MKLLLWWKNNKYYTLGLHVCSPSSLSDCTVFSTLSHKRRYFRKKFLNLKCVVWFSLQILSETFLILKRTERDIIKKYILIFMWSDCFYCQALMKLEFFRQIFEKCSNTNLHKNLTSGSRVALGGLSDRRTDRQTYRWTDGQKDGHTDRETGRERNDGQTCRKKWWI